MLDEVIKNVTATSGCYLNAVELSNGFSFSSSSLSPTRTASPTFSAGDS